MGTAMARLGVERLSKGIINRIAKKGRYADGRGLYLQVKSWPADQPGIEYLTKSWVLQFTLGGRLRYMGLGQYDAKGDINEVRERARKLRSMVAEGVDPIDQRKVVRANARVASQRTFKACADEYIAAHEPSWKNPKHRTQWRNTLDSYVHPVIGHLPVTAVSTDHIKAIIKPLWDTKNETAARVRGRIEVILDSAKASGYRTGENPARWKGHLELMFPPRKRVRSVKNHGAVHYSEVPAFIAGIRKRDGITPLALEFTILTATRTGAVIGAEWSEFDFDKRLWTIPADRPGVKIVDGKDRDVPLSDRAVEILRAVPLEDGCPYVFIGGKAGQPLSNAAMLKLVKEMTGQTTHGFRSSFKEWCEEMDGTSWAVSERALQHKLKDPTHEAYLRSSLPKQRALTMQRWADYCCNSTPADGNIVPIRAASGVS